ncbi:MAG: YbaK/EbsC family protein [Candidatus Obscuribacterales bacterium]|nr:YbaK/EbsC family protein [Candidatus Obscuribacterales bacterium]
MTEPQETSLQSHNYLDSLNLPYEKRTFPENTKKGAANVAHAIGIQERQAVKTLVFAADTGEFVLVMLGGDQNAVSGLLKKAIGSRNIKLAPPEKVKELTGYEIGSIPPFHWQAEGFYTLIEATLMQEKTLGVGTGSWGNEILISPKVLVEASRATVVNLTIKE